MLIYSVADRGGGAQTAAMADDATFEQLLAEGAAAPVDGWDFSWFEGRATEERPPWGYSRLLSERLAGADAALDMQTGGGEVFAEALGRLHQPPATVAATESWEPNLAIARRALAPFGGTVEQVADDAPLPFPDGAFDLVAGRHPVVVDWAEVARVLRPGGRYLSQRVGPDSVRALSEFMLGPLPAGSGAWEARRVAAEAEAAGLVVDDLREARLRMEFFDVAAVAVFLRKVIWIVPGFTVEKFADRLAAMHERIRADGPFVAHSTRVLLEAHGPTERPPQPASIT